MSRLQGGTLEPLWVPNAAGLPDGTKISKPWSTSDYTFRAPHVPLEDWKKTFAGDDPVKQREAWLAAHGRSQKQD